MTDRAPPVPEPIGCEPTLRQLRRHLGLYVTALWGTPRAIAPVAPGGSAPYLEGESIHLPAVWPAGLGLPSLPLYRAAAAHAAAHLAAPCPLQLGDQLRPRQRAIIGLVEDARVEALAIAQFPGLRRLWASLHPRYRPDNVTFPALLSRLSLALLDPAHHDDNHWVAKGVRLFREARGRLDDPSLARELGTALAHDIGQMRLAMDEGHPPLPTPYRDDHRHLWALEREQLVGDADSEPPPRQETPGSRMVESPAGGRDLAFTEEPAQGPGPEGFRVQPVTEDAPLEYLRRSPKRTGEPVLHPEWNHRTGILRPRWCTVHDRIPDAGPLARIDALLARNRFLLGRLQRLIMALRLQRLQRQRGQTTGDDLDLNAALRALVEMRAGFEPDSRLYIRAAPYPEGDLSTLLLLDLSESANTPVMETGGTLLDLTLEATVLLAHTLSALHERFAVHGFASNGRHEVHYRRFKEFADPYDDTSRARLAGMAAGWSTRMGAALRHAGAQLQGEPTSHRLVLVVTDGEPSDVDVFDPDYLVQDARNAVQALRATGIQTYCLSLDPRADRYVGTIFGRNHYGVVDHVARLPERLTGLYLALTRRR